MFLADENIPLEVVYELRHKGIDIISLSELNPGIEDEEVLLLAVKERRTLITFDNDFGELVFKMKKLSKGVILLRFHPHAVDFIVFMVKNIMAKSIDCLNWVSNPAACCGLDTQFEA